MTYLSRQIWQKSLLFDTIQFSRWILWVHCHCWLVFVSILLMVKHILKWKFPPIQWIFWLSGASGGYTQDWLKGDETIEGAHPHEGLRLSGGDGWVAVGGTLSETTRKVIYICLLADAPLCFSRNQTFRSSNINKFLWR